MGVNELWSILEPVCESVPLYSLAGKTLAVDLSLWVCEAQSVKEMVGRVTKPHLRNLFFRVSALTLMGIKLIFVMEGEAPKIKAETMSKRTELRFGGAKKQAPKPSKCNRSRFKFILKECAEMLDCLGVPWVTAKGEAEAMCAFLDSSGLVDGCITNDGDTFLYGAQTIYRNFNMNTKDPQVDCYKMKRVQSELHLDRETLVGVAVLLGCDYMPKGIPGVGKEQTLKLIETLKGKTLLQKFSEWKDEGQVTQEKSVKKITHCPVCHHPGTSKFHEHHGCKLCNSKRFCEPQDYEYSCPCDWHRAEQSRQISPVINEFLVPKDSPVENVTRRKPNLFLMQNFALDKMDWPKHYTSEKVLALMTYTEMTNIKCGKKTSSYLQPIRICKSRVRNGVACFEIIWKKPGIKIMPPSDTTVTRKDLDCSQSSKQQQKLPVGHTESGAPQGTPVEKDTQAESSASSAGAVTTADSPSVSVVIDELQLSEIDWDALSFTSSPQVQKWEHTTTATQAHLSPGFSSSKEKIYTTLVTESDKDTLISDYVSYLNTLRPQNLQPVRDLSDNSLRSRDLLKNATEHHMIALSPGILTTTSQPKTSAEPEFRNSKVDGVVTLSGQAQRCIEKEFLSTSQKHGSKHSSVLKTSCLITHKAKDCSSGKPLPKYKFSRTKSSVLSQKSSGDPGDGGCPANRKRQGVKSVCIVLSSSSDNSDAENMLVEQWSETSKSKTRQKSHMDYKREITERVTTRKTCSSASELNPVPSDGNGKKSEVEENSVVFISEELDQGPVSASQMCASDEDDSVNFANSPLPLAERLKLRYF
uniref:Flap endonuclease GEN homolog 1 n=1 Tax=Scleropages formosus TaxID=113540 RepID=A0A8C9U436_SCLFO